MSHRAVTTLGKIVKLVCVRGGKEPCMRLETEKGNWYFPLCGSCFGSRTGFVELHRSELLDGERFYFHDICLFATLCMLYGQRNCAWLRLPINKGVEIAIENDEDRAWKVVKCSSGFMIADPFDHLFEDVEWVDAEGKTASEEDAISAFSRMLMLAYVASWNTAREFPDPEASCYSRASDALREIVWRRANRHNGIF